MAFECHQIIIPCRIIDAVAFAKCCLGKSFFRVMNEHDETRSDANLTVYLIAYNVMYTHVKQNMMS